MCLGLIVAVYVGQIFVFTQITEVMGFEWILALFFSIIYLAFPTIEIQVIFNENLQRKMLTEESSWALWFMVLVQIYALVAVLEVTQGEFSEYFNLD